MSATGLQFRVLHASVQSKGAPRLVLGVGGTHFNTVSTLCAYRVPVFISHSPPPPPPFPTPPPPLPNPNP
jgi:hypothetical protein